MSLKPLGILSASADLDERLDSAFSVMVIWQTTLPERKEGKISYPPVANTLKITRGFARALWLWGSKCLHVTAPNISFPISWSSWQKGLLATYTLWTKSRRLIEEAKMENGSVDSESKPPQWTKRSGYVLFFSLVFYYPTGKGSWIHPFETWRMIIKEHFHAESITKITDVTIHLRKDWYKRWESSVGSRSLCWTLFEQNPLGMLSPF